jgi:hypothetical protein
MAAAALLAEHQKNKRKKRLFSEPILNRLREKFLKIQRRRAMSLPLEGKQSKSKIKFHIGDESSGKKRKLEKSASCDAGTTNT